jgi:hypothetical protein
MGVSNKRGFGKIIFISGKDWGFLTSPAYRPKLSS